MGKLECGSRNNRNGEVGMRGMGKSECGSRNEGIGKSDPLSSDKAGLWRGLRCGSRKSECGITGMGKSEVGMRKSEERRQMTDDRGKKAEGR